MVQFVGGTSRHQRRVAADALTTRCFHQLRANFAGEGPGIYEMTAAEVLGIDVSAVDRLHRQSHGKVPELACLGRDTLVFTDNGIKPITEVKEDDLLWDGDQWVRHGRLPDRGAAVDDVRGAS